MEKSKAKCPKCKSSDLWLQELWSNHYIEWEQIDGEFDRQDGVLEPGDPTGVRCKCKKCHHIWTPRNTPQIDYLIPD